jgi:S-formylglutathione hydrolase FrmB
MMLSAALAGCADSGRAGETGGVAATEAATTMSPTGSSGAAGSTGTSGVGEVSSGASDASDASDASGETSSSGAACADVTPGPAEAAPYMFMLGGQVGWSHDDGFSAGWLHTFDALDVGGPADAPHKVHVLLPRDYDPCGPGYPVIYFNDGSTTFWPAGPGNKTWDAAGALAQLYAQGELAPVIVVAIEPNDRDYEYSHAPWAADVVCCGVEQYTAYVADHVRGFVDAHYRTATAPGSNTIIGSSRGGLAAFYLANRRPEVFGQAGCLSSSFWIGLDPVFGGDFPGGALADSALVTTLAGTLADPRARPKLWIDWGLVRTGGFHNEVIEAAATARGVEMVALLKGSYGYQEGAELVWVEDPEGEHDETSWGRRLPEVFVALLGGG